MQEKTSNRSLNNQQFATDTKRLYLSHPIDDDISPPVVIEQSHNQKFSAKNRISAVTSGTTILEEAKKNSVSIAQRRKPSESAGSKSFILGSSANNINSIILNGSVNQFSKSSSKPKGAAYRKQKL